MASETTRGSGEAKAVAADDRNPFEHAFGVLFRVVVLQIIENRIHVDDRLAHARNQQFGKQCYRRARIARPIPAIEQRHHFARGLQRVPAQRDEALPIAPELHRNHVFRFGTGVEVDPAQCADQGFPFTKGPWTCFVADEQFGRRLRNIQLPFEPVLHSIPVAADVKPQHFARRSGLPADSFVPSDDARATCPVEYATEQ